MYIICISIFGSLYYVFFIVILRRYFVTRLYFSKNKAVFSVQPSAKISKFMQDFLFQKYILEIKQYGLFRNYVLYVLNIILGLLILAIHVLTAILEYSLIQRISEISFILGSVLYILSIVYISKHPVIPRKRNYKRIA